MIDESRTLIESDYDAWPRVRVTIHDNRNPWPLELFFAHAGDAPAFLGFSVLMERDPAIEIGREEGLAPRSFARLARVLPMYVDYARASIEWKWGDRARALEAFRTEAGKTGRGLPDPFYRGIADEYAELVRGGDPHPIKTIAEKRPVDKSRASRWVREARNRGYVQSTDE